MAVSLGNVLQLHGYETGLDFDHCSWLGLCHRRIIQARVVADGLLSSLEVSGRRDSRAIIAFAEIRCCSSCHQVVVEVKYLPVALGRRTIHDSSYDFGNVDDLCQAEERMAAIAKTKSGRTEHLCSVAILAIHLVRRLDNEALVCRELNETHLGRMAGSIAGSSLVSYDQASR